MRPVSARRAISPQAERGSRVQVGVRIRPANRGDGNDERVAVRRDTANLRSVAVEDVATRRARSFEYDYVFVGGQDEVYANIGAPMLEEAYKGFNVCLFAYGQTGSGKTHSILGDLSDESAHGVLPRFVRGMFHEAQRRVEDEADVTIKITMSMVEIYMEKVRDLLVARVKGQEPESLEIHEDQNKKVYVRNAGVHSVLSCERVMELLAVGSANRQTGETKMNETSSRSHSVVQFTISQIFDSLERRDIESVVSLVDLAGSERQGKTDATGQQFEEAKKINQSLLMLGRALNSFSDGKGDTFVSLRESKLTRLLSESFGGNSKTWMLATVSPAQFNVTESLSTLEYAQNALCITNRAEVNRLEKNMEVSELKTVVESLETKLTAERNNVDAAEIRYDALQRRVASLRAELEEVLRGSVSKNNDPDEALAEAIREQDVLRERLSTLLRRKQHVTDTSLRVVSFSSSCVVSLRSVLANLTEDMVVPLETSGPPDSVVPSLRVALRLELQEYSDANSQPVEWRSTGMHLVSLIMTIVDVQHLPKYACGGAQVSVWFHGQHGSATTTPIVHDRGGNPSFEFQQKFLLGPRTDGLVKYLEGDVLHFHVSGFV